MTGLESFADSPRKDESEDTFASILISDLPSLQRVLQ